MAGDAGRCRQLSSQDFTSIKVLGKGSYGKVMLVRSQRDCGGQKLFAMKVLKKADLLKRGQVQHTITERSVLQHLSYPFIVQLFSAFASASRLHLVLEYCPGGELFFHLERADRFCEDRCRFYTAELALALEYLHRLGIVYRDLKPENVLLDQRGHVKLTDFGLCKEGVWDNCSAKTLCGTPEYMSPELLQRRGAGRAADWYALGVLVFEMLTGSPPFTSDVRTELDRQILESTVSFPEYMHEGARALVRALLCRSPEYRLGGGPGDGEEVRGHIFFDGVDWVAVERLQIQPPFRPVISSRDDVQNFDTEYLKMPLLSTCSTTTGSGDSFSSVTTRSSDDGSTCDRERDHFEGFEHFGEDPMCMDESET